MGVFDKARGLLKGREQQVKQAVDKVGNLVDAKTKHKYHDTIEKVEQKAGQLVDRAAGTTTSPAAPASEPAAPAAPTPPPPAPPAAPTPPAGSTPADTTGKSQEPKPGAKPTGTPEPPSTAGEG